MPWFTEPPKKAFDGVRKHSSRILTSVSQTVKPFDYRKIGWMQNKLASEIIARALVAKMGISCSMKTYNKTDQSEFYAQKTN